jgi:hypothetical protein
MEPNTTNEYIYVKGPFGTQKKRNPNYINDSSTNEQSVIQEFNPNYRANLNKGPTSIADIDNMRAKKDAENLASMKNISNIGSGGQGGVTGVSRGGLKSKRYRKRNSRKQNRKSKRRRNNKSRK